MKKVILTSGEEVTVYIHHHHYPRGTELPPSCDEECRENSYTKVKVCGENIPTLVGFALVHPLDFFCRKTGRKIAAQKLLRVMRDYPKEDRRRVFQAVCPEFKTKEKVSDRGADQAESVGPG